MRLFKNKTVPDLFQNERDKWLEETRAVARKLLKRKFSITIEDVLEKCPRPQYVHPNTTGRVFLGTDFKAIGWQPSMRPSMNGRQVRRWTLNTRDY